MAFAGACVVEVGLVEFEVVLEVGVAEVALGLCALVAARDN